MGGHLYVLSGPSGSGKSTLGEHVRERMGYLGYSISHTSRRPREGEVEGKAYHFVDRNTFEKMIDEGAFVEWAKVYEDYYGTSFNSLENQTGKGLDIILDIDPQGAKNIRARFRENTLVYILPPSLKILEKRLHDRGTDDEQTIQYRLERAVDEIGNCTWYDFIVVNEDLEQAISELSSIIGAVRSRTENRISIAKELFPGAF